MQWDWLSFVVGALAGVVVLWLAAAVAMAGTQSDRERSP
jgi:hypothetical protein